MYMIFFLLPVEVSTIPGHFRKQLVMLERVHFSGYHMERRTLPLKKSCAINSRPPIMISTKLTLISFPGKVTATTKKIQIPGHECNFQEKKSEYCTLLAVLLKFLSARLNSSLVFCKLCSMVASSLHSSLPE